MTPHMALHAWLDFLSANGIAGAEHCTCPHEYKALGILEWISLGKGWVRMKDDPACPVHGIGGDT